MITIHNRFDRLKAEFKQDTGIDVNKDTMEMYIQYFNARMNDRTSQLLEGLTHELLNKIDFLPDTIRLRMAEMIREHEVFKALVANKS